MLFAYTIQLYYLAIQYDPHLKKACHPPVYPDPPGSGFGDPAENLQKCRLPRPFADDDPGPFPLLYLEGNILECPEVFGIRDEG